MRVDIQNRIIELDRADFRFNIPLMDELPKGCTFLGTVIEAIPVFNIDSYEAFKEIRYSDYSFSVYIDGEYLTTWFGHHHVDSECLLDWQVEQTNEGYKVVNARGFWNNGDIIPFADIRILDDHFETCDGIHTLYIAKRPNLHYAEYFKNCSTHWRSSMISAVGIESNEARFETSPNYFSGYFTLTDSGHTWTIKKGGVSSNKEDFIQKQLKDILYWQSQVTEVSFDGEVVFKKEVA